MEYTNSLLIDCELRSPYNSGRRTRSIDRITPHCVVGQLSAEEIGNCFLQAVEAHPQVQRTCDRADAECGRVAALRHRPPDAGELGIFGDAEPERHRPCGTGETAEYFR